MAVEIREIQPTKRNLLKFVHFPIDTLYRDSKYFVPPLVTDELNTLRPDKNPASAQARRRLASATSILLMMLRLLTHSSMP